MEMNRNVNSFCRKPEMNEGKLKVKKILNVKEPQKILVYNRELDNVS